MSALYIHVPFCHKACYYCDFHFSTSLKFKSDMMDAIVKELEIRKEEWRGHQFSTLYFGGGTPSLLENTELEKIMESVFKNYSFRSKIEFTLEANPEDINKDKLNHWKKSGINRLSIGLQSFHNSVLNYLNRNHNSEQSVRAVMCAKECGFKNITIDLIYGIPTTNNKQWSACLNKFKELQLSHLSAYCLTVEKKTTLSSFIEKGKYKNISEEQGAEQFGIMMDFAKENGYIQYEISNFAKPGYESKHNKSYWNGDEYLGVGPSAHSFINNTRQWNVSNNLLYINNFKKNILPFEKEIIDIITGCNEYIMTKIRTIEGINLNDIQKRFQMDLLKAKEKEIHKLIKEKLIVYNSFNIQLTQKGKFFADKVAMDLFLIK